VANKRRETKNERDRSRQEAKAKAAEKSLLVYLGAFVAVIVVLLIAVGIFGNF
jgi:hypothetical protein